jgi:Na+-driven multidrug efflux pump
MYEVLRLSLPAIISLFFQFFVQLINTYYVGRHLQDTTILAGVGMGNMLINVCCFAFSNGLNSALETLVS